MSSSSNWTEAEGKCALPECGSAFWKTNSPEISLHTFPHPQRYAGCRERWIQFVRNTPGHLNMEWEPGPKSSLCSRHFLSSCRRANNNKSRYLLPGSVPTKYDEDEGNDEEELLEISKATMDEADQTTVEEDFSCSLCHKSSSLVTSVRDDDETRQTVRSIVRGVGDGGCHCCPCHWDDNGVDEGFRCSLCPPCLSSVRQLLNLRRTMEGIVSRLTSQKPVNMSNLWIGPEETVKVEADTIFKWEEEEEETVDPLAFDGGWGHMEVTPSSSHSFPSFPVDTEEAEAEAVVIPNDHTYPLRDQSPPVEQEAEKMKDKKKKKKIPDVCDARCDICWKPMKKISLNQHKALFHSSKMTTRQEGGRTSPLAHVPAVRVYTSKRGTHAHRTRKDPSSKIPNSPQS